MRKVLLFLCMSLVIGLTACLPVPKGNGNNYTSVTYPPPASLPPEGDPLKLCSFSFIQGAMSMDNSFNFEVDVKNGQTVVKSFYHGEDCVFLPAEPVLEPLGEIVGKYRLDLWDEFHESVDNLLDGTNFSLYMCFEDGRKVYASGYGRFPVGYGDACSEIQELLGGMTEVYAPLVKGQLFSDDIESIQIHFTQEDKKLSLLVLPLSQDYSLSIEQRGYSGFMDETVFSGRVKAFPFDTLQALVRKHDIPTWNDWTGFSSDASSEHFYMEIEYRDGEIIEAGGTAYPENYAAFREDFFTFMTGFIQDNQALLAGKP